MFNQCQRRMQSTTVQRVIALNISRVILNYGQAYRLTIQTREKQLTYIRPMNKNSSRIINAILKQFWKSN